jgi:hypothetical protein
MLRKLLPLAVFGFVLGVTAHSQNPPAQTPPPQTPPPGVLAQGGRQAGAGNVTVWAPHTVAAEPLDVDLIANQEPDGCSNHGSALPHGRPRSRPISSPNPRRANWALKT